MQGWLRYLLLTAWQTGEQLPEAIAYRQLGMQAEDMPGIVRVAHREGQVATIWLAKVDRVRRAGDSGQQVGHLAQRRGLSAAHVEYL